MIEEILGRLATETAGTFAVVSIAANLDALVDQPPACPAAFVIAGDEASAENERVNGLTQRTEQDVHVVLVVENQSDAIMAAAATDMEAVKAVTRAALIGWQPPSAMEPLTHVSGRVIRAKGGVLWWEMTLSAVTYLEAD